ncbi:type II toxin-antitoxin system prevent-host-death family antitoxin [Sphingomonas sp.]|jgi:prevent-host-death family protein|uniref:type II toxin-antitoxin system Phd/YefM family antitoxin n=1 Tax=Sphingomonas sp. TaxID=28214 RepID=UPI002ED7FB55
MNAPSNLSVVNVHDAKTNFSRLLDRAHGGEEIVLAKAGVPYAKLVPFETQPKRRREPGGWPELAKIAHSAWSDPLPGEELDYIDDRPEAERQ